MAGEAGVYPGRRRAGHALGPTECHDARPQPGIRSQNPVVAVTVDARGRDELREGLEGREQQLGAAVYESTGTVAW